MRVKFPWNGKTYEVDREKAQLEELIHLKVDGEVVTLSFSGWNEDTDTFNELVELDVAEAVEVED